MAGVECDCDIADLFEKLRALSLIANGEGGSFLDQPVETTAERLTVDDLERARDAMNRGNVA